MSAPLVIRTRADSATLRKAALAVEQSAWDGLGFLSYTRPHFELYTDLLEKYPDYQLCLVNEETGYPVAVANCVPFSCTDPNNLPEEGWDWLVESAAHPKGNHRMLGGLAVSVPAIHRSKGYARLIIRALLDLAKSKGLEGLVVPVRPSAKSQHPWVSIDEYVGWTDHNGRVYDPWLRSHIACGAKLVGPCTRSMVVDEPLAFWESWAKQTFDTPGAHIIAGALTPITVDLDRQTGRYEEPNVWVAYAA